MTTALQKYDIGRVFPTPDALILLLGDGFASWIDRHTDARPVYGSTKLALSGGIYDEIHTLSNSLGILESGIAGRIAEAIGAELDANGGQIGSAISSAIHTLLDGPLAEIATTLAMQGEDIDGFLSTITSTVEAKVLEKLEDFPELDTLRATLEEIANLDLIKHLLAHNDDGEIILEKIVLREVKTNPDQHRVLNLCGDGALNKEYYCITGDGSDMTIVLPDSGLNTEGLNKVNNGDNVYIEFRSTGNGAAPVAAILTESQFNAAATPQTGDNPSTPPTSILFGVLTSDTGLDENAMYTRIRATYCYGKWMAEVVQFTDAGQAEASQYDVVYDDNRTGLSWGYTAWNILLGSYQLAGKQEGYCGIVHSGWNTQADGKGTHYALGQTIIIDDDNTVPGDEPGANKKLVLYAEYATHTLSLAVSSAFPQATVDTYYRTEGGGVKSAAIYNASAFNSAVAGWHEQTVRVQISFWWRTNGGARESCDVTATCNGASKTLNHTGPSSWSNCANAFTIQRTRNQSNGFSLPTIQTSSNEGCIIPYISAIIFE